MYKISRVELDHMDAVEQASIAYERDNGSRDGVGQIVVLSDEEFESLMSGTPTPSGVSVQPIVRASERSAPNQREANLAFNIIEHKLGVDPDQRLNFIKVMVAQASPSVKWAFESDLGACIMTRDADGMYFELVDEPPMEEALLLEIKVDDLNRRIAMLTHRPGDNYELA